MTTRRFPQRSLRRSFAAIGAAIFAMTLTVGGTSAHGPDPILGGGLFAPNQDLRFRWRAGWEPASAIKTAIREAADDANASRGSRAATFTYDAAGPNPIGYGLGAPCGVNGLACFSRDAPNGFTMWLREQGHVFDWGTLKWCQSYASPPNGCYDAETIALDEFGHVETLNHHVNWSDDSDYEDAIVQTFSRTKPSTGWNLHTFRRCDVATLQLQYDMVSTTAKYATCLDLTTVLTVGAAPASIIAGRSTTITATLKVADYDSYLGVGGNLVSARTVILQRRAPGGTAWTTVGTMATGPAAGTYVTIQAPGADTDYRAVFNSPPEEGLNGDTSPTIRVTVASACSSAVVGLPTIDAPCV
jgi:hypothetical protein